MPAIFGSVLVTSLMDVQWAGWTYAVILLIGFLAMIGPYVLGWARSIIALLIAGIGVLWVLSLEDIPVVARVLLVAALLVADAGLSWLSLQLGHVWKPEDAVDPKDKANPNFPYPYF